MSTSEYLPSPSEKFPSEPGQGSASQPQNHSPSGAGDNPFKLRAGQFEATLAATKAVLTDPAFRRHQGAKTLFSFFLEFSFEPSCGGIRAGSICAPLDLVVSLLHAKRHSVIKWKRMLINRGYLWEEKIPSPTGTGWPWTVVHVACLVPKSDQRELFPSAQNGTWRNALYGTLRNASLGTLVGARLGTSSSAVSGTLTEGGTDHRMGGASPAGSGGRGNREFTSEKKARLETMEEQLRKLTGDKGNFKRELKKSVADQIAAVRSDVERWEKSRNAVERQKAIAMKQRIADQLASPLSYEYRALKDGPAQVKANLTRKIAAIKQELSA